MLRDCAAMMFTQATNNDNNYTVLLMITVICIKLLLQHVEWFQNPVFIAFTAGNDHLRALWKTDAGSVNVEAALL